MSASEIVDREENWKRQHERARQMDFIHTSIYPELRNVTFKTSTSNMNTYFLSIDDNGNLIVKDYVEYNRVCACKIGEESLPKYNPQLEIHCSPSDLKLFAERLEETNPDITISKAF